MIRWLIIALLALAAGAGVSLALLKDNGYVLIGYGAYTIEGSLALLLLVIAIGFAALYFTIRFLVRLWATPRTVRDWNHQRHLKLARRSLTQGLVEMAEGNWASAEQRLIRHVDEADTPLLNYLVAARAAQLQGAHHRRDEYLQLAHKAMPSANIAVGLTQAELQLSHQQMEQALATLKHLRGIAPRHTHVLNMLLQLYERLGDWEQIEHLLPELKRRKVVDAEQFDKLQQRVLLHQLEQAAASTEPRVLYQAWRRVPRARRHEPALVLAYARLLASHHRNNDAIRLLQDNLRRSWNEEWVNMYGLILSEDPAAQLTVAEQWLKKHPDDAGLLLTLGRLSLRNKLWGKARNYLEASLAANPSAETYQELGNLLDRLGETEAARNCYRQGLNGQVDTSPVALPADISPPGNGSPGDASDRPAAEPPSVQALPQSGG